MANYAALATQKNIDDDSIKSKFQNYLIDLHTAVRKITNLQVNMKRLHEKFINITQFCVLLTQHTRTIIILLSKFRQCDIIYANNPFCNVPFPSSYFITDHKLACVAHKVLRNRVKFLNADAAMCSTCKLELLHVISASLL